MTESTKNCGGGGVQLLNPPLFLGDSVTAWRVQFSARIFMKKKDFFLRTSIFSRTHFSHAQERMLGRRMGRAGMRRMEVKRDGLSGLGEDQGKAGRVDE